MFTFPGLLPLLVLALLPLPLALLPLLLLLPLLPLLLLPLLLAPLLLLMLPLMLPLLPPLLPLSTLVTVPFPLPGVASATGAAPGRLVAGFVGLNVGFVELIEDGLSLDFSLIGFDPLALIVPAPGTVTGFFAPTGADVVGGAVDAVDVAALPVAFDEVNRTLPPAF